MSRVCRTRFGEVSTSESEADGTIPVKPLIVFEGKMHGVAAQILKDDGCNTNVVSKDFVQKHSHLFNIEDTAITVTHSKRDSIEMASQVIIRGTICIGSHSYCSNWAVADCRYDVLLGMPWHVATKPNVDYDPPAVSVDGTCLPLEHGSSGLQSIKVSNIGVKKFRALIRKKGNRKDFQVIQLVESPRLGGTNNGKLVHKDHEERVEKLLS